MEGLRGQADPGLMWCMAARVALHEDNDGDHYATSNSGQLMVSCLTLQHSIPVWALCQGGDKARHGLWGIPALGTEVLLQFDNGDVEGDVFLVGFIGRAPSGLVPGKQLMLGTTVEVRSPDGSAAFLPTLADLNTLKQAIQNAVVVAMDGGASLKSTILAALSTWPTGTTVLKGE